MIVQTGREIKTLSPTSLAAWLRCRGDWYNRYVLKSERGGTWNMMAGNCIHLGTQTLHQGGNWKEAISQFYDSHAEIFTQEGAPSLETMFTLMRIYELKNPPQSDDKPETYFKVEIPGLDQPITGIFDLLRDDGIIEFKTGGWWTQTRADLAMQTIHYSVAYKFMFGKMPKFFRYYAFDFENVGVRSIETGVQDFEIEEFIIWMQGVAEEMQDGVIIPRCRFTDNKQVCWYPDQCREIEEYNHSRAIKIDRNKPGTQGAASVGQEADMPQSAKDKG